MAKLAFFAVFVAALVAVSIAQDWNYQQSPQQCQSQLQQISLHACQEYLDRKVSAMISFLQPPEWPVPWRTGVKAQCCQQLQSITPQCRCVAIHQLVRQYEQQHMFGQQGMPYGQPQQPSYGQQQGQGPHGQQQRQGPYGQPLYGQGPFGQPWYGQPREGQKKLVKLQQYAVQLPAMCQLEPQQCSFFSIGQPQY